LRHQAALRDRVALEVRESHTAHASAVEARTAHRETLSILEEAALRAERAERAGDQSMLAVYESRLRLIDCRIREADARAEVRRTFAQLERSVGGRLP
jgi:outer membrane protein, heavy metal efflux system